MGVLVNLPTYRDSVNQRFIVESIAGPQRSEELLNRFDEEIFRRAPEGHLYKFLFSLLGPAGVGWLQKQVLEQRLFVEALGLELYDLDKFYANPFSFGRIFDEYWDEDPTGLLTKEAWQIIKAKDERYRGRAIDFMHGARAGNTPFGMRLVSKSGLGYDTEIIENYKYLFDVHSDDPIGLEYYGVTTALNEMVVLPRPDLSRSEVQTISIEGAPTGGTFVLFFNGQNTTSIPYDADFFEVQDALRALPNIGENGVVCSGGDLPANPIHVKFQGHLSHQNVAQMDFAASLSGGTDPVMSIDTVTEGVSADDEIIHIPARDRYYFIRAIDRLRPVGVIPTVHEATGIRQSRSWSAVDASSTFVEVQRYVTGARAVAWPTVDQTYWIESDVEKEAPRIAKDVQYHYMGFQNVLSVSAYDESALLDPDYSTDNTVLSNYYVPHVGRFAEVPGLSKFQYLFDITDDLLVFEPDRILADYFEPLTVTTNSQDSTQNPQKPTTTQLVNGIYPADYAGLPGVPPIRYTDEQFWASLERQEGTEYIEIDFGRPVALNFLSFEVCRKPISISIDYDTLDQSPQRNFTSVTPTLSNNFPNSITFNGEDQNPWYEARFYFNDAIKELIFTRFVRIGLTRVFDEDFLYDQLNAIQTPWSIDVKNLRLGRVVSNF